MDSIVTYLLAYNQYLLQIISYLLNFILKYIPLKKLLDDTDSPKYNKFKVDRLPKIYRFEKVDYQLLIGYYEYMDGKPFKPVKRRKDKGVPENITCPKCGAPHIYLYNNNGDKGQYQCKVCRTTFKESHHVDKPTVFKCPYCGRTLSLIKERKEFNIHKCLNNHCPYYLEQLKRLSLKQIAEEKHKFKLRYIYREFTIEFMKMDLNTLPKRAINFNFRKFSPHIMGLCLTYHVNLNLSTRTTADALRDIHGVNISHATVANYAMTAAAVIKPFVDNYKYKPSKSLAADETYIKVNGVKHYVWFIMDTVKKSVLGYQVSDTRSTGPCILAMRMAFEKFTKFPQDAIKFIADGFTTYPLAQQEFFREDKNFELIQVIGLTNDDEVSTEYRWAKQMIERLNRTFKFSYRVTNGYSSSDGAFYGVSLWVAYYNFLRPHKVNKWNVLNEVEGFKPDMNMPAKWLILLRLGQEKILELQEAKQISDFCS
ncbi:Transposase (or an inactivated derivative) [Dethiosulfatibacter aminovorans DSM 17477]|uniref:Transposase (Or an inactivated derivative) n=1 Tax=Dethiosulfatibacter aminovorans DSM 17477 TaxID=1121476 RepID=A0A1M6APG2_9FIRM|nr:DDE-type integrase/transposase/recombinase [Dethiosulfatibacter aminovorans]SHI38352.1 Transposase (or an inactivated derivative) [Dethiosulfatibacter aminovorans DSM 17477]